MPENNKLDHSLIDVYFPYKKDGQPSYRLNQREVIVKILEAWEKGKKAVCLDSPVGSGKSVILYTALRILGRATYITAQKMLQDQIGKDSFENTRILKGKNAYVCNLLGNIGCDRVDTVPDLTCAKDRGYKYRLNNDAVDSLRKEYGLITDKDLSRRSFLGLQEVNDVFREECDNMDLDSIGLPKDFFKKYMCNMKPIECSCKSARNLSVRADIVVLNPDIYYALNRMIRFFADRKIMAVDEAHKLDSAIQRMFRIKIPIDFFRDITGIDLNEVAILPRTEDFCVAMKEKLKDEIFPYIHFIGTLGVYTDFLRVYSADKIEKVPPEFRHEF